MSADFQRHLFKLEDLAKVRRQPRFSTCQADDPLLADLGAAVSNHISCLAHYCTKDPTFAKTDIDRLVEVSIIFVPTPGAHPRFLSFETATALDLTIEMRIRTWARMTAEGPDLPYLAELSSRIPVEYDRARKQVEELLRAGIQCQKKAAK